MIVVCTSKVGSVFFVFFSFLFLYLTRATVAHILQRTDKYYKIGTLIHTHKVTSHIVVAHIGMFAREEKSEN